MVDNEGMGKGCNIELLQNILMFHGLQMQTNDSKTPFLLTRRDPEMVCRAILEHKNV